jgi:hypothetical protein
MPYYTYSHASKRIDSSAINLDVGVRGSNIVGAMIYFTRDQDM